MKKSKFVLLSLILIVLLSFSLFFVPVEVKAASDSELDIDIEEYWVQLGWPLSAMNYKEIDGKGIRFNVDQIAEIEFEGTTYRIASFSTVEDYSFDDGYIYSQFNYPIPYQFCSDALISVFNYYFDTYGFPSDIPTEIPKFDRMLVFWDVDQRMFVGPDFLIYQIETFFNAGYREGLIEKHKAAYYAGYQEGITENHEAAYYEGYDTGYGVGYVAGFDAARPELDILLITLIMYILSIIIYFKFNLKWVLIGTTLLWFVPIFLVDNIFVKIFSVIMIIATITITFFSERQEEY